jgi:signal transduction histidine kinase/DNA-binding response OmpR family regulator
MSDAERVKVLIVDDLPEKLLVYQTILEELGQDLLLARSGAEALKLLLQHEFAVILLDVNMPGMDGFETASLIRQRRRSAHTPIIFITSYTDDVRTAEGYALGAVDCMIAPVAPAILRAKVMAFVNMERMARQAKRQADERLALAEERSRRTAAEEANRRLEVLANAGKVIGASLDYETTLHDVLRLAVLALADAACLAYRPQGDEWQFLLARRDGAAGVTTTSVSAAEAPLPLLKLIGQAEEAGVAAQGDFGVLLEPLQLRDELLGAIALERTAERPFESSEATLLSALASRAAVALDNALLYRALQYADRQKNEFLSMLAHELRNPLAPIRTGLEILRLGSDQPELLDSTCDIMERQVSHLVRLVDDLLDVSRITQGKIHLQIAEIDAAEVVRNALEISRPLIEARGHRLTVELPESPVMLRADLVRLTQVVSNLVNNAAKYTEDGGRILVSLSVEDCLAKIAVRDTGVGIPPDILAHVFDLFVQADRSLDRSAGGLGVGLTLARHLIHLHGGTIHASSEGPGQGSEFAVRLPLVEQSAPVVERAEPRWPLDRMFGQVAVD